MQAVPPASTRPHPLQSGGQPAALPRRLCPRRPRHEDQPRMAAHGTRGGRLGDGAFRGLSRASVCVLLVAARFRRPPWLSMWRKRAESSFFSCWCVYFRRQSCLAMCAHWQFSVDRHCVAMCAHRPCLADLHGSGARFHSQRKKEQHKCRETTETQMNFFIDIDCCAWFANSLFFLQRRYRDMHSVTVKGLAGGREFSPAVFVS